MTSNISIVNQHFKGAKGKISLYDFNVPKNWNGKLIVFIHGYMGYKDWGCWHLVESYFVDKGYGFLKYNGSHNGGTIENPIDFDDLESFSNNSYSNELSDLNAIIEIAKSQLKGSEIYLIGHSRGGGMALLQSTNTAISKICSWAGISSIGKRFPSGEALETWKEKGVRYYPNGRTKQEMPHSIDQYFDYTKNKGRLDIEAYCKKSTTPTLAIHGDGDTSIKLIEGQNIAEWLGIDLTVIKNTQHTFDSMQPWTNSEMPEALKQACDLTIDFFNT